MARKNASGSGSSSPPPYTANGNGSGSAAPPQAPQQLPPLLAQMAKFFNIPEATIDIARRGSEANLVLSTLALSLQQMQMEMDQLRAENARLRFGAPGPNTNVACPLANIGSGHAIPTRPIFRRPPAVKECAKALMQAAEDGNESVMLLILSHANVDVNAETDTQRTVLHFAALHGYDSVVQKLLQHPEIDSDPSDRHGSTPLLLAAENGHESIVRLLLEDGGVDVNARDGDGDTPLSCVTMAGHAKVLELLLEHSPDSIDVNILDNNRRSPLSWAAAACTPTRYARQPVKTEEQAYAVVKPLLQRNDIQVNLRDNNGKTALRYALEAGFMGIAQMLRAAGAV